MGERERERERESKSERVRERERGKKGKEAKKEILKNRRNEVLTPILPSVYLYNTYNCRSSKELTAATKEGK